MDFAFRESIDTDLPFLKEILYEAIFWRKGAETPTFDESLAMPEVREAMADFGRRNGDLAVIATAGNGKPAGAAWWRYWRNGSEVRGYVSEEIPVIGIAVVEVYRRRGIARGLMKWLIDHAADHSVPTVSLCVSKDNPALGLYREMGFTEYRDLGRSFDMIREISR